MDSTGLKGRVMNPFLRTAMASLAIFAAVPAAAQITDNGNGSWTIQDTTAVGDFFTVDFNGVVNGTIVNGLTSSLIFTFEGTSGNSYIFGYNLANTSSSPITNSVVTVLGFDTDPLNALLEPFSSVTGTFTGLDTGNMSQQRSVDICFLGGQANNCTGGNPNAGAFYNGTNATGQLTLAFANDLGAITLSNFHVRYQSIAGTNLGTSGVGDFTPGVPEPATWAMMLLGFGAVGLAIRRRRPAFLAQAA